MISRNSIDTFPTATAKTQKPHPSQQQNNMFFSIFHYRNNRVKHVSQPNNERRQFENVNVLNMFRRKRRILFSMGGILLRIIRLCFFFFFFFFFAFCHRKVLIFSIGSGGYFSVVRTLAVHKVVYLPTIPHKLDTHNIICSFSTCIAHFWPVPDSSFREPWI